MVATKNPPMLLLKEAEPGCLKGDVKHTVSLIYNHLHIRVSKHSSVPPLMTIDFVANKAYHDLKTIIDEGSQPAKID